MYLVRDPVVMRLVERISEHYRTNIANRFIRPALLQLSLDKTTWDNIEVLTEKYEQSRYQGFHLDELYRELTSTARFVAAARREISPSLRTRLNNGSASAADKVLRDMAVNNFSANLQVLADLLYEMYTQVIDIDKAAARNAKDPKDRIPLCEQISEFRAIGDMVLHG